MLCVVAFEALVVAVDVVAAEEQHMSLDMDM